MVKIKWKVERYFLPITCLIVFVSAQNMPLGMDGGMEMDLAKHGVTFEDSLSEKQQTFLKTLMMQKMSLSANRDFDQLNQMSFWHAMQFQQHYDSVHDIDLVKSNEFFNREVRGHGCYCWPDSRDGDDKIHGFGKPTDSMDRVCFNLWNCYRCVNLQPGCRQTDWVNTHYPCAFGSNTNGEIEFKCNGVPGECSTLLCQCDAKFALDIKAAIADKEPENFGIFPDLCEKLVHNEEILGARKQCCGTWPEVKPFPPKVNCCGHNGKTYKMGSVLAGLFCVEGDEDFVALNTDFSTNLGGNFESAEEHVHAEHGHGDEDKKEEAEEEEATEEEAANAHEHEEHDHEAEMTPTEEEQPAEESEHEHEEENEEPSVEEQQMQLFMDHQKFHADNPDIDEYGDEHTHLHSDMDRALYDLEYQ